MNRAIRSDRYFRALFENTLDAVLVADDEGRLVDANPAAVALLAMPLDEILALHPWDITPLPQRADGRALWAQFVRGGEQSGEYALARGDGGTAHVHYRAVANVLPGLHLSVLRDVTDRKRAEQALRLLADGSRTISSAEDEHEVLEGLCRAAVDAGGFSLSWVGTIDGDEGKRMRPLAAVGSARSFVDHVPVSWCESDPLGRGPSGSALRMGSTSAVHDVAELAPYEPWHDVALAEGFRSILAVPLHLHDGPAVWTLYHTVPGYFTHDVVAPLERLAASVEQGVQAIRDKRERRRLQRELSHLAYHDALTGLGNRRSFTERANDVLTRSDDEACLMLLDLDDFKKVNDMLGHAAGDELLVRIARRLKDRLRDHDVLARLGGDEFAILLPGAGADEAGRAGDRIHADLAAPVDLLDAHGAAHRLYPNASIGMARFPSDGRHLDELLRKADIAMYRIKAAGGGCAAYDAGEDLRTHDRGRLEADLRDVLSRREADPDAPSDLSVHYQPAVDLLGGGTAGVEALVRWHHPERGPIPPDAFTGMAEESGAILAVDRFVLGEAVRRSVELDVPWIAVNLSPKSVGDRTLPDFLRGACERHGADPSRLCLEITERGLARSTGVEASLRSLRALGCRLALDDFGTGYSSLAYLSRHRLDYLKVDASFVTEVGTSAGGEAIARTVVAMAHELGMRVVAEGVETGEHLDWLRSVGFDVAQGYLFSPAMTLEDLRPWLARESARSIAWDVRKAARPA